MYVTQVTIQCLAQVGKINVEVDPGRNLLCMGVFVHAFTQEQRQ